ncbi:olfactory receptor 52E2-like [Epinephelus moara]|uniref:olfactory receptor 52E2-like n=1 Tax=Epinephelus moara TaxID=300413 RepID=UPI00214EE614|nr:olfactory receptor 52E2-like [Epinephelus moara]
MNSSMSAAPIIFTIYSSFGLYNVALVICICVLYVSGLCINLVLILVVCVESRLHRPMYVLLVNLAVSGVMGSSSVCPAIIKHLVANRPETSLAGCLTQVFFINMYSGCIFSILALMAYDRYVSICKPLLYHSIMTPARVRLMLLLVYVVLSFLSAVQVYLTSTLRLCTHTVDKLACDSNVIANLSCKKTHVVSVYGLCCVVCLMLLPCVLVLLSYVHIFMVVCKTSRVSQMKALQTCTPHLVTFLNFSMATFFGVLYNRLNNQVPKAVTVFTYINFFVVPPLLHPIIYGIKMQEIQQSINRVMKWRVVQL